jgi:hypothetical protein
MTAEEGLVVLLTTDTAITALIGAPPVARVYPLVIPQDADMPAIAYQRISSVPSRSHSGFSGITQTRFQVTAEADMYSTVKALAIAIRRRCEAYHGGLGGVMFHSVFVENETDGWADFGEPPAPVVRIDLMVTHSEV